MNRMPDGKLPKEVWQYKPTGQRSIGSVGEVDVFPLGPEQVILLFLDGRRIRF